MQKMNKIAIGKKFRELRKHDCRTLQNVADKLKLCHRTKVSQFERGKNLSFDMITKLCELYNMPLKQILEIGNNKDNQDNHFSLLVKNRMISLEMDKQWLMSESGFCFDTINSWLSGNSFPSENSVPTLCRVLNIDKIVMWETVGLSQKERFNH